MPTYLYCLLGAGSDAPPTLAGVAGAPVRALGAGSLVAWVSDLASPGAPAATPEHAAAHDAVSQAAVLRGDDVVPARFGQWFESDAACLSVLSRREPAVLRALAHVRGCVERRVIVPLRAGEHGATASEAAGRAPQTGGGRGREYLAQLRGEQQREWNVQQRAGTALGLIDQRMAAHVRDTSHWLSMLPAATLTIAHLVARGSDAAYAAEIESVLVDEPLRAAVVTGPWAPYSFTGLANE